MKNKGQVEVQFNWIFVLIVGAIILSFFVVMAMKQKQSSESSINVGFFNSFEKALSGISAVQGKVQMFEVPNMDLNYECTSSCLCEAYAGTIRARATAHINMVDKIIFSPNKLQGNNLLTVSRDWSYPFRITNFLFISSPEVKYLIEDTPLGNSIYGDELFPSTLKLNQIEQRAFDKQLFVQDKPIEAITGNYKVKFVFTETIKDTFTIPEEIRNLPNKDVTAIYIERIASSPEKVRFYEKDSSDTTKFKEIGVSYLFGETTLFGAIFAEDLNAYACMMEKAAKKYEMISRVYSEKQQLLTDTIKNVGQNSPLNNCLINYVRTYLDFIVTNIPNLNFNDQLGVSENNALALNIADYVRSITVQNDRALQNSCPQIY